jgi:hypothetical protein
MKDQIRFDTESAATILDSDHVGSHTLSGSGDLITSGDGDSDNLVNTDIEGLDVRGFNYGYDATGDNWDRLQATGGALHVFIDDGDFEVDVVIEAEKAEDSAHSSGHIGNYVLGVRIDDLTVDNSALLAGTNGDYQGFFTNDKGEMYTIDEDGNALLTTIDAVLDSIKVDTAAMVVDLAAIEIEQLAQGVTLDAILVDTSSIDAEIKSLSHAEDAAHISGDAGIMGLTVRIDDLDSPPVGTLAGTEGDYQSMHTNARGALFVAIDGGEQDVALAQTAIANAAETLDVASTAQDIIASPLSDRKYVYVYNIDNRQMFIGANGVTAANGFPISPGSYMELRAGAAVDIEYVSPKLNHEIRTMELS